MPETIKYDFSFTATSLRLQEMIMYANARLNGQEIDYVRELGKGKAATGIRFNREFLKRIGKLTDSQVALLAKGDLVSQKQMAFLAVCKSYGFLRDFVVEVLREKYLLFDHEFNDGEYISFFRRKIDLHPDMEDLTETTQKKIRQVSYKILEQAGIIENVKSKIIQPQLLDNKVTSALVSDDPNWLKIFLISDMDINTMIK
ncbi:MAG: DUF1819 family protein [Bacteroidetes bacterium]|jgi:hypothetical protein|nr:DUF1819 family protein [Bacteroidota bacterium]MBT7093599.1 DUF1819 family protein [Bacteroidota bacterium]